MKKSFFYYTALIASLCSLQSCYEFHQLWYASPMNASNKPYLAKPTYKDSSKTATYAHLSYYGGTANDYHRDAVNMVNAGIYQARKLGDFQFYYGGNFTLGNYVVHPLEEDDRLHFGYKEIDYGSNVHKPFSSIGLMGGVNYTIKQKAGEIRLLGLEFATNKEYGSYLSFRNSLADSSTTVNMKSSSFSTIGLNSEWIGYTRYGHIGVKFSYDIVLEKEYQKPKTYDIYDNNQRKSYDYTITTFVYNRKRYTLYLQSASGIKAGGTRFGVVYRLF